MFATVVWNVYKFCFLYFYLAGMTLVLVQEKDLVNSSWLFYLGCNILTCKSLLTQTLVFVSSNIPLVSCKENAKGTTSFTVWSLQTDVTINVIGGFQSPHKWIFELLFMIGDPLVCKFNAVKLVVLVDCSTALHVNEHKVRSTTLNLYFYKNNHFTCNLFSNLIVIYNSTI